MGPRTEVTCQKRSKKKDYSKKVNGNKIKKLPDEKVRLDILIESQLIRETLTLTIAGLVILNLMI